MLITAIVAGMGFTATIAASILSARLQHNADRDIRLLEARVRAYVEVSDSLFEYIRANYNRHKARVLSSNSVATDDLKQVAYRCNTRARSAIGRVVILTHDRRLQQTLEEARQEISSMQSANSHEELRGYRKRANDMVEGALQAAQADLIS